MTHTLFLEKFIFFDLLSPEGWLTRDDACHACWYYYLRAHKAYETVGTGPESQKILEGELWMDKEYVNIRKAVCLQYGLTDLGELDKYWSNVALQAKQLGLPEPLEEYKKNLRHRAH